MRFFITVQLLILLWLFVRYFAGNPRRWFGGGGGGGGGGVQQPEEEEEGGGYYENPPPAPVEESGRCMVMGDGSSFRNPVPIETDMYSLQNTMLIVSGSYVAIPENVFVCYRGKVYQSISSGTQTLLEWQRYFAEGRAEREGNLFLLVSG